MSRFIESTFSGLALLMMGSDFLESRQASNIWKDLYAAKCDECDKLEAANAGDKNTLYNYHNTVMELMTQNQELERATGLTQKALNTLINDVENLGLRVSDEYTIIVPKDEIEDEIEELG